MNNVTQIRRVYYVLLDDYGEPFLAESVRSNREIKRGFKHGRTFVNDLMVCYTKEEGIKRFNFTREELGCTR